MDDLILVTSDARLYDDQRFVVADSTRETITLGRGGEHLYRRVGPSEDGTGVVFQRVSP